ncbi:two pore domain potassium channel family protein [Azoarcus sp. L1K30]|uniref:two pore domain potassium channel family protein n=1 Tax=Azoarcus sp. L1K30 TaxID=2820277 RepID=UPI001B83A46F|nr:two pore domain potassium channel family protein [Azoarcus sp. L1K30]MBR0566981.1 two pore domain potassium channel family protein [Azoarcus sp. L1K30]
MLTVVATCIAMLCISTLIHFEVLTGLTRVLPTMRLSSRFKLLVVLGGVFFAHVIEIALYSLALLILVRLGIGSMTNADPLGFQTALYFSAETYTSLGYGDLVPTGSVRLLASSETLTGLLLIGWSASYIYIAMERFWAPDLAAFRKGG